MPFHLIFLFLFQSGLALAFTYFISRVLLGSAEGENPERVKAGMRKVSIGVGVLMIFLPVVMFFAYFKSLPEGKSFTLALWPALWIFMILLGIVLGIVLALVRKPSERPLQ